MWSFTCRDLGWDCPVELIGESREDVARKIVSHIHEEHGFDVIPTEILMKACKAISNCGRSHPGNVSANIIMKVHEAVKQ